MSRRPSDSAASPVWRAGFEVFAPLERLVGPVIRRLLRIRVGSSGALGVSPDKSGDVDTIAATFAKATSSGLLSAE